MKTVILLFSLLFMVVVGCSGGDGTSDELTGRLTGKTFTIANPDQLNSQVSVPTTRSSTPGKQVVPASSGAAGSIRLPLPESITFSPDGTFRLTYSDGSFLQGSWRAVDGQLELTLAGMTGLFEIRFPTDDTIEILFTSASGATSGSSSGSGSAGGGGGISESVSISELMAERNLIGTWCWESGLRDENDGAIAKIIFQESGRVYVGTFEIVPTEETVSTGSGSVGTPAPVAAGTTTFEYQEADFSSRGRESFTLRYSGNVHTPIVTISGTTLEANYAPFKQARFVKESDGEVVCGSTSVSAPPSSEPPSPSLPPPSPQTPGGGG